MGTCDEMAIDVLLNMLFGYSRDHSGLRRIFVGGTNTAWPTPEEEDLQEAGERGAYPKVRPGMVRCTRLCVLLWLFG